MEEPIAVAVVGVGHLGRHHLRLAATLPCWRCVGAFDTHRERLGALAAEYRVPALPSLEAAVERCQAAIVATPTVTHREVAEAFLAAGKHVLVEKPLAASVEEGEALVALAEAKGVVFGVGHVEFFNPAVQAVLAQKPQPRYLETQRLSPFTRRSLDVDVVLDLMIHDLHIVQALNAGARIAEIRAVGVPVLSPRVDLANVRLAFTNGCVANLTASRVSSERIRKLRIFATDAYYSVDYGEQSVHAVRLARGEPEPAIVPVPVSVDKAEPLAQEHWAFARRIRGESTPFVTGEAGLAALRAATAIVAAIGTPVLPHEGCCAK
jgi:predicted dehydrogenase